MWKCIKVSGRWQGEIWNRRKNGEIYPEWLSITAVRGRTGKVENYLAIFSDITLRKREERELYDLATHDALTRPSTRRLAWLPGARDSDVLRHDQNAARQRHRHDILAIYLRPSVGNQARVILSMRPSGPPAGD